MHSIMQPLKIVVSIYNLGKTRMISVTSAIDSYRSQAQTASVNTTAQQPFKNNTSDDETVDQVTEGLVSISEAARSAAVNPFDQSSTDYYKQFMPTYAGFSSANIAAGVANPSLETFSAGKEFSQVALDARASLDKNYEKLYELGKPFSLGTTQAQDINSLLGELDRRALFAVSSNKDDLFTTDEQSLARGKLNQQQGLAMGLYSGPTSEKSKFIDPFNGDTVQKFKAGIEFLDKVGNEEKATSIEFAFQRAGLQVAYERGMRDQGKIAEDFSTDNPLILLIIAAMDSAKGNFKDGFTEGVITTSRDLEKQTWFEDYKDLLSNAIQDTQGLYLPNTATK